MPCARHVTVSRGVVEKIDNLDVRKSEDIVVRDAVAVRTRTSAPDGHRPMLRGYDGQMLPLIAPDVKPYLLKPSGTVVWRGALVLIDGSSVQITLAETPERRRLIASYAGLPSALRDRVNALSDFASAAEAVIRIERCLNAHLFGARGVPDRDARPACMPLEADDIRITN